MIHSQPTFTCKICDTQFTSKFNLGRHKLTHPENKSFSCDKCHSRFTKNCTLKRHMLYAHTDQKPYQCLQCPMKFALKYALNSHLRTHVRERLFQCHICSREFKEYSSLKRHSKTIHDSSGKTLPCVFCNKWFQDKTVQYEHIRRHIEERPYFCVICGKCYGSSSTLISHKKRSHPNRGLHKMPRECIFCSKLFKYEESLEIHVRVHIHETPFPCQLCDSRFPSKDHLRQHFMSKHDTVAMQKYTCPICQKVFTTKVNGDAHLAHHAEMTYQCPICHKSFLWKSNMQSHMVKHRKDNPFQCKHCPMNYTKTRDLQRHLVSRHGADPATITCMYCIFCGRRCTSRAELWEHLRREVKEKPYNCFYCDKSFSGKRDRDHSHYKLVHRKENSS